MEGSEWVVVYTATFVAFAVQTTLGFAAGLVGLPILLLALPIATAVAFLSIFNLCFSLFQLRRARSLIRGETYRVLAPGTILGVITGACVLSFAEPDVLKPALGIFILLYLAYRLTNPRPLRLSVAIGFLLSLIGGFFAGLFSSGAPPFVVYLSNRFSEPAEFRANLIGVLAITNLLRPIVLIVTGVLSLEVLRLAAGASLAFVAALWAGERVFKRLSKQHFLNAVLAFLALSALA
ncbi:MAG: sulfite exporter TauE/SafE family protein, partial [Bdellovibrionales bacterium]|nr:sulfite exporter TauE/SafE family protein [Bdellovibrionales bacterium]